MVRYQFFDFLICGPIATEFIIDLRGTSHEDILGGSLLYAAGGLLCWAERLALLAQSSSHHGDRLNTLEKRYSIDITENLHESILGDDRIFWGYKTARDVVTENPIAFYASRKLTLPRGLIGFDHPAPLEGILHSHPDLIHTFPKHYESVKSALILAGDLRTQLYLTAQLQFATINNIVLQSSAGYMQASFFDQIPALLKDVTVFVSTTAELIALFQNRLQNISEMADYLCGLGCEYLVLNDPDHGQRVFDVKDQKQWQVPAYPSNLVDPTGMEAAFCGGFLAGFQRNYDPLEACLHGNISSSFTGEGTGPFFCADTEPGLAKYRLENLKGFVKVC